MTNFQQMLKAANEDVTARNIHTIEQYNAALKANGLRIEVEVVKGDNGINDVVAVFGETDDGTVEGYYTQADLKEHPTTLVWKISNTLKYFNVNASEL